MKQFSSSFFACAFAVLVAGPLLARADVKPNFDDDAKPILSQQPGLIEFVESKFQVKSTGIAKYPGDDDHAPAPPYIFNARPRGSNGPYSVRLLIQPGPPGHILGIVDGSQAPPQQASKAPAPAQQQAPAITSDTPSGPIGAPVTTTPASNAPNLAPPADPAPQPH